MIVPQRVTLFAEIAQICADCAFGGQKGDSFIRPGRGALRISSAEENGCRERAYMDLMGIRPSIDLLFGRGIFSPERSERGDVFLFLRLSAADRVRLLLRTLVSRARS